MYKYDSKVFSRNLRSKRAGAGLTQGELSELSGISRIQICQYENDNHNTVPGLDKAYRLASALGCTIDSLVSD